MEQGHSITDNNDGGCFEELATMKIPETVRVGGLLIDVVVIPGITMLEDGRYGVYREASQRIELSGAIGHGLMVQTFIHEIIHAICFDRALSLKEREVDQIANGLVAFMVDNELV